MTSIWPQNAQTSIFIVLLLMWLSIGQIFEIVNPLWLLITLLKKLIRDDCVLIVRLPFLYKIIHFEFRKENFSA